MQEEFSFGVWLRKQRRALDLTRKAFADQVGCAEITVRRIEAGTLGLSSRINNVTASMNHRGAACPITNSGETD
jgi:predicted transcriptional regulator